MSDRPQRLPRIAIVSASALSLAALAVPLWLDRGEPESPRIDSPISTHFEFAQPGTTRSWHAIEPLEEVEARNAFRLGLEMSEPLHLYIASFDLVRGHASMWPSSQLRSRVVELRDDRRRLRAGKHQLPGQDGGRELCWQTGESIGALDIFVIASRQPLEELEAFLSRCRQVGNRAFPQERILDLYAPDDGMSVNPTRARLGHELLQTVRDMQTTEHDGPIPPVPGHEGVFGTVLRLRTPLSEGTGNPLEELRGRLETLELTEPPSPPSGR
ncbi:MAG: hypothetical protein AAF196_11755 [Planctomycetota bacterium]